MGSGTSEPGAASSDKEQQQGCFSAISDNHPARTTAILCLHQHGIAGYGAPHGHVDVRGVCIRCYQRAATAFGRGVCFLTSNTFKEAMALPEAARWKAASDKGMESLRPHKVYDLVPSIPPSQKAISSLWVYNIKADNSFNPFGTRENGPK